MLIFIIGYMGSGKSTFGKQLAEKLDHSFLDLDELIEKEACMSVAEIFENAGEDEFRQLEHQVLLDHLNDKNTVIATGGGTPCHFDNMDLMNEQGITIFLDTPVEIIIGRLIPDADKRPLLKDISEKDLPGFIREHLEIRRKCFQRARFNIKDDEAGIIFKL